MRTFRYFLCFVGSLLAAQFASAAIVGPYTPNSNTLFLVHFDEAPGNSLAANVGLKGGNFITTTNTSSYDGLSGNLPVVTTLLGQPAYTGFGYAVRATNADGLADGVIGYDGNGDGSYTSDSGSGTPDAIAMTNLDIGLGAGNSPFTIEALVKPATITNFNQEIVCSDGLQSRGFQFRINSSGQLEFNMISQGSSDFTFPIPTSGANAFVPGAWYHVALTYDGKTLRFYWTRLDPSFGADNLIGSVAWTSTTADGSVVAPLVIGGENRGGENEAFQGLIDEVRISKVALGAGQMMFSSAGVTISQEPASQNIDNYMPVNFQVGAASQSALGYQWYFNNAPVPNATNSSYSIASVTGANAGNYYVVVTNAAGYSETSATAKLVVGAAHFLAHRWSFTGNMVDSVGGANGTSNGTATVTGGALVLDGSSNCFMSLPGHLLNGLSAVTFDFWATFGTNVNDCRVFDFGNTNFVNPYVLPEQNYVYFSPHTSGGTHQIGISGGSDQAEQDVAGAGTLDGQDVHVTCVVDPPDGVMSIYTNGVLEVADTNLTVPLGSLDDQLDWIGGVLTNNSVCLNARIDEFRIYDGALSAASVEQSQVLGPSNLLYGGPVELIKQPVSITTAVGQPVTFSSVAIGDSPIAYQWYENGSPVTGATNNSYSFVAASGQNGDTFYVTAANTVQGTNFTATSTSATLTLTVPESVTWLGVNGSSWDTTALNWSNATAVVPFAQFDAANFTDQGSGQPVVNVTQPISLTGLSVNSSGNYVFVSSAQNGSLSGEAPLVKQGTGTLTVDLPNHCAGGTLIQGGTLQIGNADGAGTLGAGPVTNNAVLAFNRTNSLTVTNIIVGTGSVQYNGSGSVTVSGTNNYTGSTLINNGTVFLVNGSGLGAASSSTTVGNGAELYITANVNVTNALAFNGNGPGGGTSGALRKGGGGLTTCYGPVTLNGSTTLRVDGGATLELTNSTGLTASTTPANLTLTGDTGGQGNIVGPLSLGSTATLTVNGATWTVAPNNSYSGSTTINGGALRITGSGSLGPVPGSFNASQINLNGGTLEVATNVTLNDGNRGITLSTSSTITVDTNATFTVGNDVSGGGSVTLTKSGPGTLVLSGANDFLGFLDIDTSSSSAADGATVIANNAAIANLLAVPGIPSISIGNNNAGTSTLGLDGSAGSITVVPDISLAGRNNSVPAIDNLAGSNTISGNFELAVGGSYILQADKGTLTLTAPWPYAPPAGVTSARNLVLGGAGTIVMTGGIQDSASGSTNVPTALVVTGPGVVSLPTANSYSGTTVVSNGVLSLTGSIGTNTVTITGGLLVGSGSIAGPVTVQSTGAIEAGTTNAIGTLHLTSTLALSGNTVVKINGTSGASDVFSGQSSVTYGGTLTVTNLGGALTTNSTFTLFTPGASASNFASIVGAPGPGLRYHFANGVLSVIAGPPSSPTNIVVQLTGNQLTLSWPQNYTGWELQVQTNNAAVGLSTNWFNVPGATSTNQMTFTVNPTNGCVFYRMMSPN